MMKRRKGLSDMIAEAAQNSLGKAKEVSNVVEQGIRQNEAEAAPNEEPAAETQQEPAPRPVPPSARAEQQAAPQPSPQKPEMVLDTSLCPGCFGDIGGAPACPNCGYDLRGTEHHPIYLPPGLVLHDRYIVGRVLGQGGFGVTYLGYDKFFLKPVAVKEYLPTALASRYGNTTSIKPSTGDAVEHFQEGLRLFLEEARNLAKLDHPNIIKIENYFEANNTGYMVMNFVAGPSLSEHLKARGGRVTWAEARAVIMPLLDALEAVHEKSIFHRDISTQNILLAEGQTPILIDFGAARQVVGEQSRSLDVVLKPGYSPLEQFASKGNIGPWTDVYATAATIHLLLTGVLPPAATDRIYKDELVSLASLPGLGIPEPFGDCILKALAVRGDDRWQSVGEFRSGLLEAESAHAQPQAPAAPPAPKAPKAPKAEEAKAKPAEPAAAKPAQNPPAQDAAAKGGGGSKKILILGGVAVLLMVALVFALTGKKGPDTASQAGQAGAGQQQAAPAQPTAGAGADAGDSKGAGLDEAENLLRQGKLVPPGKNAFTIFEQHLAGADKTAGARAEQGLKGILQAAESLAKPEAGKVLKAMSKSASPGISAEARAGLGRLSEGFIQGAKKKMAEGDCAEARTGLEKALALDGDSAEARKLLAEVKASKGVLSIYADPWGYIVIDGKKTQQVAPVDALELSCGKHTITLQNPDFKERTVDVDIRAKKRARASLIKDAKKVLYD